MNILYVEDDRIVSELAKTVFLSLDHTVIWCEDIKSAAGVISHKQKIDLILLDLKLPDGDAVMLLKLLEKKKKKIPVIIISGYTDTYVDKLKKYKDEGTILTVYNKPIKFDGLISDINLLFSKR